MNIVVAGGTGMVGRALVPALRARGHQVTVLVRDEARAPGQVRWGPNDEAPPGVIDAADAVINLAGANIAGARWSGHRKQVLLESRLQPTRSLVRALGATGRARRVLINASATGFYGDTGDSIVSEASPSGDGFLAEICRSWEAEALAARAAGIRVLCARFGVILGPGGALGRMAPIFRWGLGGRLGSGRQWMSWIGLRDVVAILLLAMDRAEIEGALNVCSPEPVRNVDFTAALGSALQRHVGLPVPALAISTLYGRMGKETLLASCRAVPDRLVQAGYQFIHPRLQDALPEGLAHP